MKDIQKNILRDALIESKIFNEKSADKILAKPNPRKFF